MAESTIVTPVNVKEKFEIVQHNVVTTGSVAAASSTNWDKTFTKSGYYPLCITGFQISGTGSSWLTIYTYKITSKSVGSVGVTFYARNHMTNTEAKPTINIDILWVKAT